MIVEHSQSDGEKRKRSKEGERSDPRGKGERGRKSEKEKENGSQTGSKKRLIRLGTRFTSRFRVVAMKVVDF